MDVLTLDENECFCRDSMGRAVTSVLPLGIMNDAGKIIVNVLCDSVSWNGMDCQKGIPNKLTLRISYEGKRGVQAIYKLVEEIED